MSPAKTFTGRPVGRAAPKRVTSWSFSRYASYSQCPYAFKLRALDKLPEPEAEPLRRGNQVHAMAEDYIKAKLARIPTELKAVAPDLRTLRKIYQSRVKLAAKGQAPTIEETWALRRDWTRTVWNDWAGCWLRIKLDAAWWLDEVTIVVDDWKTGKFREEKNEEYLEQLELYALGALVVFPHAERVLPRLRYVDENDGAGLTFPPEDEPIVYTCADVPRLKRAWEKRTVKMLADTRFAPRPGWYCQGCYFSHATVYGYGRTKQPKPAGPCKF